MVVGATVVAQLFKNFILVVLDVVYVCHDLIAVFITAVLENVHVDLDVLKLLSDGLHGGTSHNVTSRASWREINNFLYLSTDQIV